MIDQSHNITDPIESLLASAEAIAGAFARAQIVDRDALASHRDRNDVMEAFRTLRHAYDVDVAPILALVRVEAGGAADPILAYRAQGAGAQAFEIRLRYRIIHAEKADILTNARP
jgi:L-rhamnose isomerase/sugar isomerase